MLRDAWLLDPDILFLNHGSFGATPIRVLDFQRELRDRMEREPVRFMVRELEPLLDAARESLARFAGAAPEGVAFVTNATAAINAVLRSMTLDAGDELLTTTHEYNATRNTMEYVAASAKARVVPVAIPFPIASPDAVLERILAAVTPRTRLAVVDQITSQTALVFPIERIVRELGARGIETLVDAAHAPGMFPLELEALGAAYYTGNCHKWVCAPKGAAFLYVRADLRDRVRPIAISHGANTTRSDRSRYLIEFDWTGTFDPTAWLSIPEAIRVVGSLVPGGWPEVMRRNRELALVARDILCETLGIDRPAPDAMLGSMAAVPLPDGEPGAKVPALYGDPIQDELLENYRIEVPVVAWPAPPKRVLRISAQLYNERREYEALAAALTDLLS